MKRVLIVDDEHLIRFSISRTFMDVAEVQTAGTGEEACEKINDSFYDICFLDLNLPGKNGLEVMDVICSKSPDTKVIILTAYINEQTRSKLKDRAYLVLEKPFQLDTLKRRAGFFLEKDSA